MRCTKSKKILVGNDIIITILIYTKKFIEKAVSHPLKSSIIYENVLISLTAHFQRQLGYPISVMMWQENEKLRSGKNPKPQIFYENVSHQNQETIGWK